MKDISWLALFSQTGSEICEISEKLGRHPNCIITDNIVNTPTIDERIYSAGLLVSSKYKGLTNDQKIKYYRDYLPHYDVITLHGWLNIIPKEICSEFKIYNGHPGLINSYPELKGKDPQVRTFERIGEYLYTGSVIHEVTEYVDCGRIICDAKVSSVHCTTLDDTYNVLKETSLKTWVDFFTNKRYNIAC